MLAFRLLGKLALLIVPATFAFTITTPSDLQGWTSKGPQPLNWQRVDTDPTSFAVVLVNQVQGTGFSPVVIDQGVDGTTGQTLCQPPSGGWPVGVGFQVNLIPNATALDSILAQSQVFNITVSTTTSTGTSSNIASPTTTQPRSTQSGGDGTSKSAAISTVLFTSGFLLVGLSL
ncbi:hypothetical protein HYPSUDRAFT_33604 [Hypholoma sublateritium FD-334 SS-4]|uniref:Yeast cell wall synthesis Kre9/Knh1-like N-terminal domain-containing protein n=1 Tax=Hypholoma sublateritium (strain FD-334 SS-4) TaxID=945553 RepID=A0A0D2LKM4_HYPSF|nr:hypothetical protein HYPSUDRAFT_33604 [Hypholoma sublateritium FD-334 SS-4]